MNLILILINTLVIFQCCTISFAQKNDGQDQTPAIAGSSQHDQKQDQTNAVPQTSKPTSETNEQPNASKIGSIGSIGSKIRDVIDEHHVFQLPSLSNRQRRETLKENINNPQNLPTSSIVSENPGPYSKIIPKQYQNLNPAAAAAAGYPWNFQDPRIFRRFRNPFTQFAGSQEGGEGGEGGGGWPGANVFQFPQNFIRDRLNDLDFRNHNNRQSGRLAQRFSGNSYNDVDKEQPDPFAPVQSLTRRFIPNLSRYQEDHPNFELARQFP